MSYGEGTRSVGRAVDPHGGESLPHAALGDSLGKRTLTEKLPAQDPTVALKVILDSLPHKTAVLAGAIAAVDFMAAWCAASDLRKAIEYAEGLATRPGSPVRADAIRRLGDRRAVADPLLAIAPAPSPEAVRERTSGSQHGSHGRWQAEVQRWKAARGGAIDVPGATESSTSGAGRTVVRRASAADAPPDLGNYNSAVGKHVVVLRSWDNTTIAARRVELQGRLSRTTDPKARNELLREYEAIEWVARERNLALPKDPGEEAAPQAFMGGKPIKFWAPDNAQGMRAMLEREMAAGTGYDAARAHVAARIGYSTMSRSAANNDKRLIGEQQTELMDHDAAAFPASFQAEAKQTALSMLDASSIVVDAVLRSYGIAGGAFRLTDAAHKVATDPGSLDAEVDKWVALSAHGDGNHAAFAAGHSNRDGLAKEAARLRALQDSIAALASEQLRLMKGVEANRHEHPGMARSARPLDGSKLDGVRAKAQPLQGSAENPFDNLSKPATGTPDQQLEFVRGALQARQAQFKAAWIQAEREHPVLAAFRAGKAPDASTLPGMGSDEATTRSVIKQVLPKLGNIYRTKAALQGTGTLDPLQLAPVVELAKQRMFVAEGSYRDRAVHDMVEQAYEKHGGLVHWAFEAVLIGLTLVTLVPTGGASGMAALALTGLAYDIYAGLGDYEDLQLMSAATGTDLDKIRSLSDTEPSLTPLLTRMISAGLNFTLAGGLFKRAVGLHRMALGNAVDREAVVALNKAGEEVGVGGIGDEAAASDGAGVATPRAAQGRAQQVEHGISLQGLASQPRLYPWRPNKDGAVRTLEQAIQIARHNGVEILGDVLLRAHPPRMFEPGTFARYFQSKRALRPEEYVTWDEFFYEIEGDQYIPVSFNRDLLASDEAIVAVFAHEIYEINELRKLFEASGGRMTARQLRALIEPSAHGKLHEAAWEEADKLVHAMRRKADQ